MKNNHLVRIFARLMRDPRSVRRAIIFRSPIVPRPSNITHVPRHTGLASKATTSTGHARGSGNHHHRIKVSTKASKSFRSFQGHAKSLWNAFYGFG